MKTSVAIMALLISTSAFAQVRGGRPAEPVKPKTHAELQAEREAADKLRAAGAPQVQLTTKAAELEAKVTSIGAMAKTWKDAEGKEDTAAVNNWLELSAAVDRAQTPQEKMDAAVLALAVRDGITKKEEITEEMRKSYIDKLMSCK